MAMKYMVVYEFEQELESKNFNTKEEAEEFIADKEHFLCLDGDFVKYYVISGEFEVQGGFIDRTDYNGNYN